ncbi:MAG: tetratricopeptide repeat protein [Desulfobacterales bacterium]|nr:tetratricopeptide repeat protein [Desulfobacterales bacterium]
MKFFLRYLFFAALIVGMGFGCAVSNNNTVQSQMPEDLQTEDSSENSELPGNSYYYYSLSQMNEINGDLPRAVHYLLKAIDIDPYELYLQKELAILYLNQRDTSSALAVVEKMLELEPDNVETLVIYGKIKQTLKDDDAAKKAYEKALLLDPAQRDVYIFLGNIYLDAGEYEKAEQIYDKLVKQYDDAYVGHFFLGKIYVEQGHFLKAEKAFNRTLELRPDLEEPHLALIKLYKDYSGVDPEVVVVTVKPSDTIGRISIGRYGFYNDNVLNVIKEYNPGLKSADNIQIGQTLRFPGQLSEKGLLLDKNDKIFEQYMALFEMNPNNVEAGIELSGYYQRVGKKDKAASILKDLGRRIDTETDIIRYIVQYYIEKERFDETLFILDGMRVGAPESSVINYLTGLSYDGKNEKESALASFKKISRDSPFYQDAIIHIAYLYNELGQVENAVKYLNEELEIAPDNIDLMLYLGSFYEDTDEFEKAETILKKGIKLEPENVRMHFRLGVIYDKWGRKDASIAAMKEVLKIDPAHANAMNYIGYTYADMGKNLDEAEQLIIEALKQKPDDGYITDSLGWVYYKKGDYDKAVLYLLKAFELVPDDPTILEHLGDAYLKKNDHDQALEFYKRSLDNREDDKSEIEKKIKDLTKNGI